MALSSTIYKVDLQVSDLNRNYFAGHSLTVAQHPSETRERMLVRILVFALNASEQLEFTRGLSTAEVPELWETDPTGDVTHWIELGQPSMKRINRACNRCPRVSVYGYAENRMRMWWKQNRAELSAQGRLRIVYLSAEQLGQLDTTARSLSLQCTVQDELLWFGNAQQSLEIRPEILLEHRGSD